MINERGEMIKLKTGKKHKVNVSPKGYVKTAVRIGNKYFNLPVHRIVAMLFCEIPDRHRGMTFTDLEVNHKDTIKTNNHYRNLEWVTTQENMEHAWLSGLVKTEVPVLTKHFITGEIERYQSVSECARQHTLSCSAQSAHLRSPYAGRILSDEYFFKFDDGLHWPEEVSYNSREITIGMNCDCVAENTITQKRYIFSSIAQACRLLELPLVPIKLHRSRKGIDVPYMGWIFYSLSGAPLSKKLKGDQNHTLFI